MATGLIEGPPHSGYHGGYHGAYPEARGGLWSKRDRRFFEGWYFRLTLPEPQQTFAFMYSIDDPAGGAPHSGGAAQILGPNETYYCRSFPTVERFWAWPHQLGLGHWRQATLGTARPLAADAFDRGVMEGYQVSARWHQGRLLDPAGEAVAQWHYQVQPVAGWGGPWGSWRQQATAGWLSYLPVFEPGWQVLMAHGLASGWVQWQGQRYEFEQAPTYAEKNWGGAFPIKWFWLQCNAFAAMPDLSVTAVGGVRQVLGWRENVGLIGIHYQGQFYEFVSTEMPLSWQVEPWGSWHMEAKCEAPGRRYRVELLGSASDQGAWVRVPTREGLQFICRDTTHGHLRLRLWQCDRLGRERLILEAQSDLAGLEVGGGPWEERWVRD